MMGPNHRLAGVVAWIGLAPYLGIHATAIIFQDALICGVMAHGILSPDMDQATYWTSKLIPGGHRGITHWWPITFSVLAVPAAYLIGAHIGMSEWRWLPLTIAVSWASHIAGDFVFGRIPILPRLKGGWHYFGLGLKTDGFTERKIARPIMIGGGLLLAYMVAFP